MTCESHGYPVTKSSDQTPVIEHACDCTPITWHIGTCRTNHNQEFCYRFDYNNNDDDKDNGNDDNNKNKNNIYRGYHKANTKLIRVVL